MMCINVTINTIYVHNINLGLIEYLIKKINIVNYY